MVCKYDSSRRILIFPAIHPCKSISLSTILTSLIDLSHKICSYKSKSFVIHRQTARALIRRVEILLIFFQETQDQVYGLSDSIIPSLSQLHFAFQKIHFLLEDCLREGARLWILINGKRVMTQFQNLNWEIGSALNALPLELMDISIEVKECVRLVTKQAEKAESEVEANDEWACKNIFLILNQFEDQFAPDPRDVSRVLNHLGIKTWKECNNEIKFLTFEIESNCSIRGKNEVSLLSSLIGFMSYCRCILFDFVEHESPLTVWENFSGNMLNCLNPEEFRCPISLDLMTDPVTISSGHTYDRSSILKWFKSGNSTCPITGKKLETLGVVPNLVLRRLIRQFCSINGIPIPETDSRKCEKMRIQIPPSSAGENAMKMVAGFLIEKISAGRQEERVRAAYEIRLLSKTGNFSKSCLENPGLIPYLLALLCSENSLLQENSMAALLNLSKIPGLKPVIVENGGLNLILNVLKKGIKMESRQFSAAVLYYLSAEEEYRKRIGEFPEAIIGLLDLIRNGTSGGKKIALVSILELLKYSRNRQRMLVFGAVSTIINLIKSSATEDITTNSLAVLSILSQKFDGTFTIIQEGGIHLILEILNSSSSRLEKEHCISILFDLCVNGGEEVVGVLVNNSSLMGSLFSTLTDGTSRASKKASSLIRILHQFYERRSLSGLIHQPFLHDRFVHVQ